MGAALDPSFSREALIILVAAAIVVPVFHRLRVSPVLGFMLVGMAVGPFGLGSLVAQAPWLAAVTIVDRTEIAPVAALGVTLLLFTIGLELSFERVLLMRRLVFGLGPLQVALSAAVLAGAARALGLPPAAAIVIGLGLAMSSTTIVVQVLAEEARLADSAGRASFAILLFQDLSVVPILFVLSVLGAGPRAAGIGTFVLAIAQAVLAILAIIGLGRLALRPLFRGVARTRSPELFMAACLLVVIATGLATASAGLSMAIGALVAGLLLAETEYRRQIQVTIEPFKGLLLGGFLISIGMSLDLAWMATHPATVLAAATGLVVLKTAIVAGLGRLFALPLSTGIQVGLLLGPGGEFSFVILGLAVSLNLIPGAQADFVLLIAALTMASIPLLSALGHRLTQRLGARALIDPALLIPAVPDVLPRVIIAGFGRVGQTVAAMLQVHQVPYVAIDSDADRVALQRAGGQPVYYGDITRIELLRRLDLHTARGLVVTIDDHTAADSLVALARAERKDLLIVARARDEAHAAQLYAVGATDAVPETLEASLQLSEAVLVDVGIAMGPVIASIHEKRAELQALIKAAAPDAEVRQLGRRRLRDALMGPD